MIADTTAPAAIQLKYPLDRVSDETSGEIGMAVARSDIMWQEVCSDLLATTTSAHPGFPAVAVPLSFSLMTPAAVRCSLAQQVYSFAARVNPGHFRAIAMDITLNNAAPCVALITTCAGSHGLSIIQRGTSTVLNDKPAQGPLRLSTRFKRALDEWKGLLAPELYDAMDYHTARLLEDQEEIDEDGVLPSFSSFDDLLGFLSNRPWVRPPAVGLNRNGQFSTSWTASHAPRANVTLTFLGHGSIRWYVYGLGKRKTGSGAGTSERLDLQAVLAGLGCDDWMN